MSKDDASTGAKSFKVGRDVISSPVVNIEQVKAHLGLLHAFKVLRTAVKEASLAESTVSAVAERLDEGKRWSWFVGLAVERFQRWVEALPRAGGPDVLDAAAWMERYMPPTDVLMVWHTYLLNPVWYSEDCSRIDLLSRLRLKDRLLYIAMNAHDLTSYEPPPERRQAWEQQTSTPFDPIVAMYREVRHNMECPFCERDISAPMLTLDDKGYLQPKFEMQCKLCTRLINKENLGIAKFVRDLARDHKDPEMKAKHDYGVYLAGTFISLKEKEDTYAADRIKTAILASPKIKKDGSDDKLSDAQKRQRMIKDISSFDELKDIAVTQLRRGPRKRAYRILSAYTDDRPFSINLEGAVMRQSSFIDKMDDFGWTQPGYFDDPKDEVVLHRAISRYHGFLDLLSRFPSAFMVPTLDIDLVWHTHQLTGSTYLWHCIQYVGRYVDHDDKVDDSTLTESFDLTCLAWKQHFKIPYTYCGCPSPDEKPPGKTIGDHLSRFTKSFRQKAPSTALVPVHRADAHSATHPSDHNRIGLRPSGMRAIVHKRRLEEMTKRRERDAKLVKAGKLDKDTYERGEGHDYPFLWPVPLYAPPAVACSSVPVGVPTSYGLSGGAYNRVAYLRLFAVPQLAEQTAETEADVVVGATEGAVEETRAYLPLSGLLRAAIPRRL
ncbi:hypothetical protein EIP91_010927 [Steccherinum ochraceum]|uniref:Uncharacterized protein n=1 Tax=Steccherinum ochraceum TaxID=92696 RepID=A0A4R0R036_9APHY|nr:hypothetical protein EIP91_010927 [Steccherinum ochraceum]